MLALATPANSTPTTPQTSIHMHETQNWTLSGFNDLPLEIIPLIVQHIVRPQHLAEICLVDKVFYSAAIPVLYERTTIFAWHKNAKTKATRLFDTLANYPRLALHVRKLELRDFPKAIARDKALALTTTCVRAIENCRNLVSCTWTRDGSLKDDILEALVHCPHLQTLEINGRHTRNYDPNILGSFIGLRKLSIMMLTREVAKQLPTFVRNNSQTLQSLSIICKFTTVIDDAILKELAVDLTLLKNIHLGGCPKVSEAGIIDILSHNIEGLEEMAIEGISPAFNMKALSAFCAQTRALRKLRSVTLTFPVTTMEGIWLADVEALLLDSPIRRFHLHGTGDLHYAPLALSPPFVRSFVSCHADHLERFAVLRLPIIPQSLNFIVRTAQNLKQLFVSMWRRDMSVLGPIISHAKNLQILHITFAYDTLADLPRTLHPLSVRDPYVSILEDEMENLGHVFENDVLMGTDSEGGGARRTIPHMEELEELATHFPESVKQFGVQSKVWQVERVIITDGQGNMTTKVRLGPYESPEIPDVFLVTRA